MSLSLLEISQAAEDLAQLLVGGRVQEIRQPLPEVLWIGVRTPGRTLGLWFSFKSGSSWLGISERKAETITPAPAFLAKLRHDLVSAQVVSVTMPWDDRIIELGFSSAEGTLKLIWEGCGFRTDLVFATESYEIIGRGRPQGGVGPLASGGVYDPPLSVSPPLGQSRVPQGHVCAAGYLAEAGLERLDQELLAQKRRELARILKTTGDRLGRKLSKVREDIGRADKAAESRAAADLLKTQLYKARRGMTAVKLEDWSSEGTEVVVPLDPALDPRENLERMYQRYRKGVRGLPQARERAQTISERIELISELAALVQEAESLDELKACEARMQSLRLRREQLPQTSDSRREQVRLPYHEFISSAGRRILVGKSAADNRRLTFQVARGADVWLHVRGAAGSHVVIPVRPGQEVDSETLMDAAHLAVKYSKAAREEVVEVSWTLRKHVKPTRDPSAPGAVFISKERTVLVRMEESRLRRLRGDDI